MSTPYLRAKRRKVMKEAASYSIGVVAFITVLFFVVLGFTGVAFFYAMIIVLAPVGIAAAVAYIIFKAWRASNGME